MPLLRTPYNSSGTRFLSTHPHMARASSLGTSRLFRVKLWIQGQASWLIDDLMSLSAELNVSTFRDMPQIFQFALGRCGYSSCSNIFCINVVELQ